MYWRQVSNELGKDQLELEVRVLAPPGPVENLTAEMIKGEPTCAKVSWSPPKYDGGAPIQAYVLEKRDASKRTWTPVGNPSTELSRRVPDLKPGLSSFFRVIAQNAHGWSEPTEMNLPLRVQATSSKSTCCILALIRSEFAVR